MRSNWTEEAWEYINAVHRVLPEKATLKERKAALRERAPFFHCGTSWGKKVWSRECRKYLERHGLPSRRLERQISKRVSDADKYLLEAEQQGDITFPFRGESDGAGVPDRPGLLR